MTEAVSSSPPLQDEATRLAALEPADATVTVPACDTADAVHQAALAARELADHRPGLRILLVYPSAVIADGVRDAAGPSVQLLAWRLPAASRPAVTGADGREAFGPLSTIGGRVNARAFALVGAQAAGITAETMALLLTPVLDNQIDLVLPSYPRHPLDGLINTGIVYPLVRALYGRQADGQLGLDFGLSPRLLTALQPEVAHTGRGGAVWLLSEAVERGLAVGQAYLPAWLPPVEEAADLSSSLTQVLGSLFTDLEQHATIWQRVRGSRPVPSFGSPPPLADERRPVDVRSMIDSFQLGYRNLQEVWTRVLPPATLVALGRLARGPTDGFHMPDDLWARIVFDFALGYRLRTINRDHLLRAMTPVYLAWVAAFARDVADADRPAVRDRLERLCQAYESQKPYLLARWRWPDRFTP
jgi:hypothetical protein